VRRPVLVTALACPVLLVLAACGTSTPEAAPSTNAPTETATAASAEHVEFTYEGDEGPEHWAELSPDFALCADASAQSPIDLTAAKGATVTDPQFAYVAGPVTLTNNGHTVQATEAPGSTLTIDGHTSTLAQFHLHEPAEHTVDGVQPEAELHLVHKDDAGAITVVGVLLTLGSADVALDPYLAALPTKVDATAEIPAFDTAALLPDDLSSFRYTGSLTTPPCSEGVTWVVLAEPVEVSQAQLDAFREVIEENDRPVQDRGTRELVLDAADS
jgi:carbonic anhydrase